MDADGGDGIVAAPATPGIAVPRVLAAVGPEDVGPGGERTDGAHTFAAPVQTTASARHILGPDKLLISEQGIVRVPGRRRVIAAG
jgi:hypothetical protein